MVTVSAVSRLHGSANKVQFVCVLKFLRLGNLAWDFFKGYIDFLGFFFGNLRNFFFFFLGGGVDFCPYSIISDT